MTGPSVTSNFFTERNGVIAVEQIVNNMRCIWRETQNADVGIDGQIELVDDSGHATGHVVAVQIKSGLSYVSRGTEIDVHFKPDPKHVHYWREFPVPVILVIHDPSVGRALWVDVRKSLRTTAGVTDITIRVPRSQVLTAESRDQLFETVGPFGVSIMTPSELVHAMATSQSEESDCDIGFLDLFLVGLVDVGRKLFFSMSIVMEIAESRNTTGIAVNSRVHGFLDSFIDFLVAQHVAYVDYADYLIDRDEHQLQPILLAPLTWRGKQLVDLLHRLAPTLVHERFLRIDTSRSPGFSELPKGIKALQHALITGSLDSRLGS